MKKERKLNDVLKSNLFLVILASLIVFVIYSCKDNTVTVNNTVDPNTINGTITFTDSNFISNGAYLISAYPESGWPPAGPPSSYDTIRISRPNNHWTLTYTYKLKGLNPGNYVVATGYTTGNPMNDKVMGIYGCDTSHSTSCLLSPSKKATIGSNNQGVANVNFLSIADTCYSIYPTGSCFH